jgi:hypothetical protein
VLTREKIPTAMATNRVDVDTLIVMEPDTMVRAVIVHRPSPFLEKEVRSMVQSLPLERFGHWLISSASIEEEDPVEPGSPASLLLSTHSSW